MIELNNAKTIIKEIKDKSFPEQIPVMRIDESGVSQSPNITDSNIKNNTNFIVNIFDSNDDSLKEKVKSIGKRTEKQWKVYIDNMGPSFFIISFQFC